MALRRLEIDVDGIFLVGGRFEPRAIRLYKDTGRWLPVVQVLSCDRAANLKVGGAGYRYRCAVLMGVVDGAPVRRTCSLWREEDTWFVEEEVDDAI